MAKPAAPRNIPAAVGHTITVGHHAFALLTVAAREGVDLADGAAVLQLASELFPPQNNGGHVRDDLIARCAATLACTGSLPA